MSTNDLRLFLHHAPATLVLPGLLVAYVGRRLVGPSRLRGPARRIPLAVGIALWLVVMLAVMFWREQDVADLRPLVVTGFIVFGWLLTASFVLLAKDLGALTWRVGGVGWRKASGVLHPNGAKNRQGNAPHPRRRRQWRDRWSYRVNLLIVIAAAVMVAVGALEAARPPEVRHQTLRLPRVPKAFSGYRVVQVSDVHVTGARDGPRLAELVRQVNALDVDLVALTGDLVDGPLDNLRKTLAPLAALRAGDGVYFVVGNHEMYADADACVAELRRLGVTVLLNEHRIVQHDSAALIVAGVVHPRHGMHGTRWVENPGRIARLDSDPRAALRGAPPSAFRLLLAHHPAVASGAAAAGYDLMLCGHTHGGQFFPWSLVAPWVLSQVSGVRRMDLLTVYTSAGVGTFGPPLRLGVPPTIDVITLR